MSLDMGRDTPALSPSGEACQVHRMQLGYSGPKDDKAAVLGTSHGVPRSQTACPFVSQRCQRKYSMAFFSPLVNWGAQQLTIALWVFSFLKSRENPPVSQQMLSGHSELLLNC